MLINPKKNNYVTKAEKLLTARYELNTLAIKLVSILYSNVKRADEPGTEYVIKVKDIAYLLNKNYAELYTEIKSAIHELLTTAIYIPDCKNPKNYVTFAWIADAVYCDGIITFTISKRLKPYVLGLQKKFLKYKLENILNLKSKYNIRLYEILKDIFNKQNRYNNKAEKIYNILELREMLQVPNTYAYGIFKRRILEKAQKQFKEHTDIIFNFLEIKTGRKITHIKFIIKINPAKLKQLDNINIHFKNTKYFVSYLRKQYTATKKFFAFKNINNNLYFLGLDNNGLVYAARGAKIIDFNALESARIYKTWLKIAQNLELYKQLIQESVCLKSLKKDNLQLFTELCMQIKDLENKNIFKNI